MFGGRAYRQQAVGSCWQLLAMVCHGLETTANYRQPPSTARSALQQLSTVPVTFPKVE